MSETISASISSSPVNQIAGQTAAQLSNFVDEGTPLPKGYGETHIVLLPRDPYWMHTYWEVTEATVSEIKAKQGEDIFNRSQAVLRMHEVTADARTQIPDSKKTGIQHPVPSIRSLDVAVSLEAKNWYLRADKENSSWFVELGLKLPDGKFILIARSNLITLPEGSVSTQMDEKWSYIKEEIDKIWEASGAGKLGMGSLEMVKMLTHRWELINQISSWKGGVSSGISSPISMAVSPTLQGRVSQENKGFWLVADCELVVYGATDPHATLTIAGLPAQLNPDGTFSLRFAFPEGKIELPVKAISGDRKEESEIKFSLNRKTEK